MHQPQIEPFALLSLPFFVGRRAKTRGISGGSDALQGVILGSTRPKFSSVFIRIDNTEAQNDFEQHMAKSGKDL
jgi:hypothetical protein